MKIAVWDTYVVRKDRKIMHFDILVSSDTTDERTIFDYGKQYLSSKSFDTGDITARECKFCHMEPADEKVMRTIRENGFAIIEMENCT
ncbi:MAG: DUF2024 family protein [Flavobacterium sp.]|nr:MAG: DUF2024 family protein [Flavobacterium sp.]